jgi:hypothetical protein
MLNEFAIARSKIRGADLAVNSKSITYMPDLTVNGLFWMILLKIIWFNLVYVSVI